MTAALPRAVDDDELLVALLHADPRPPRARLCDLGTVRLHALSRPGADPAYDPVGANRWDHPYAAWPWVKTAADRWVHTGWTEHAPRGDAAMVDALTGRSPAEARLRPARSL